MKSITIAHRILLMIATSVAALLIVGFVGLSVAGKAAEGAKNLSDSTLASIQMLGSARQAFMEARVDMYILFLNNDDAETEVVEKRLQSSITALNQRLAQYKTLIVNDEDGKLLDADIANVKAYVDSYNKDVLSNLKVFATRMANNNMVAKTTPLGNKALNSFDDHMAFHARLADETAKAVSVGSSRGKTSSLMVIAAGLLAVCLLGYFLLSKIKTSLKQIQAMVNRVESDLDFTVRVDVRQMDEIGHTTSAFNRLLDKLQASLKSITTGAQSVAASASAMVSTSNQVASASRQQSDAAADMAATIEEMTVSINHVADRAQETDRISSESGKLAASGEAIIGQTASDIQNIATTVHAAADLVHGLELHSQQIAKIVLVIKEVADQTNLLALNAAIEAARAGEQGRGFAVVADEVRKLAETTASSTKEIAATINTMRADASNAALSMRSVVSQVAQGVEHAHEANASIKKIGEGSRTAVGMVEEIAAAIREQGSATNDIATKVERIAQMSDESSQAAGNSAQAALELDRVAAEMQQIVNAYRL